MNPKRLNQFVWIMSGLGLLLLVWGGLGAIAVLSSGSAASTTLYRGQVSFHVEASPTLIPEARTYVVEPGDTLWTIAAKVYGNGARYPLIQQANNLADNTLRTGQVLVIPALESDRAPTPRTPTPVSATPLPSATPAAPAPAAVQTLVLPTLVPTTVPSPTIARPIPTAIPVQAAETVSTIPLLGVVVNVLGTMCLLGSIMCAFLSFDIFRRSCHIARRRYIGNRVRAGL